MLIQLLPFPSDVTSLKSKPYEPAGVHVSRNNLMAGH